MSEISSRYLKEALFKISFFSLNVYIQYVFIVVCEKVGFTFVNPFHFLLISHLFEPRKYLPPTHTENRVRDFNTVLVYFVILDAFHFDITLVIRIRIHFYTRMFCIFPYDFPRAIHG